MPWKVRDAKDSAGKGTRRLLVPGFETEEMETSSLRESRTLSLYASQCISMELADTQFPTQTSSLGESKLPVAVIATPDGTPVTKVENKDGKLR